MDAVTKLADLKAWMAQHLPGCTDAVMEQQLRDTWRIFCQRSMWWRPAIDISLTEEDATYPITLPYPAHVLRIAAFTRTSDDVTNNLDGRELPATAYRILNNDQTGQLTLYLNWTPRSDETGTIRLRPVLVPKLATQSPPPVYVLERWGDALAAGAVWHLAQQRKKAWSNPDALMLPTYQPKVDFENAISRARRENVAGLSNDNEALKGPLYPVTRGWNDMPWGGPK